MGKGSQYWGSLKIPLIVYGILQYIYYAIGSCDCVAQEAPRRTTKILNVGDAIWEKRETECQSQYIFVLKIWLLLVCLLFFVCTLCSFKQSLHGNPMINQSVYSMKWDHFWLLGFHGLDTDFPRSRSQRCLRWLRSVGKWLTTMVIVVVP